MNKTNLLAYAIHLDMDDDGWDEVVANETGAWDGEQLWLLAGEIASRRSRLAALGRALNRRRLDDIRENGPVRYGDTFITKVPKRTRRIDFRLIAWATLNELKLHELFRLNADNLRITTLREMAGRIWDRQKGDDTIPITENRDEYIKMIEETFVQEEPGEVTLSELPITKAPQYAQRLVHGQRVGSFENRHSDSVG